jgi:hypothetical protein
MAQSLWVLIAAAGKAELLARTLRSLAACHKPATYRGAMIVENGPPCGIGEAVRSFPKAERLRHLYVPEANKSHALNCGLVQLGQGLVVMTDDDVRLHSQLLVAYDEAARGVEHGEFYGGPVLIDAEYGLPPVWLRRFYPLTIAEPWLLPHCGRTVVDGGSFMGTNWAAFAADLLAIGGFDTRVGPGAATSAAGQETEAQRRLTDLGGRAVYVPEAVAWHYLHREFLDPAWVRRRAFRHGLEWGIRRARDSRGSLRPFVRSAVGRFNAHLKGLILRLMGGEERRFEAAYHEDKWRGRWQGLWLGRQWDQLPQIVATTAESQKQAA